MMGCSLWSCGERTRGWVARHWVLLALIALATVVGFFGFVIWWTGVTWSHISVIAQGIVAAGALGGYIFSYQLYREQEKHKYMAAVVATFSMPPLANVSGQQQEDKDGKRVLSWIPGFVRKMDGSDEVLEADFRLVNVGESPVRNVRMNFYWHDCRRLDEEPKKPSAFFKDDVHMADGIAKGTEVPFIRTLRLHLIPMVGRLADGGVVRASDFSRLFSSYIPSEARDEPARWSEWNLVLKYENLQMEPFFSAYKLEATIVPLTRRPQGEYFQLAFLGNFPGEYDKHRKFIANRGFPSAGKAPNWGSIRALLQESAAIAAVAPAPSNLPPSF